MKNVQSYDGIPQRLQHLERVCGSGASIMLALVVLLGPTRLTDVISAEEIRTRRLG